MTQWWQKNFHWLWRIGVLILFSLLILSAFLAQNKWKETQKPIRIIAILKSPADTGFSFWWSIDQGFKAAAREFDVTVDYRSAVDESHIDDQISLVYDAIAEKPDAIVLAAIDKYRLIAPVEAARAAGIPVVMIDSTVATTDGPIYSSFIATDNIAAGEKLGTLVTSLIPKQGRILIVSPTSRGDSLIGRETGLRKILGVQYIILNTLEIPGGIESVYEEISKFLSANSNISGIICLNEITTTGAARAISGAGLTGRIKLVGFDSSEELVNCLEEGLLNAVVIQRPFNMGYLSIVKTLDILADRPVESFYDTGSVEVTKNNIYRQDIEKLVFLFE